MAERVFMKGCEAIAEAGIRAGCRFFAGYPITPQNEIPEYFARRMPEVNGVFVQGESEVASVNMLYGAAAAGTRAMSSSSSCGISPAPCRRKDTPRVLPSAWPCRAAAWRCKRAPPQ